MLLHSIDQLPEWGGIKLKADLKHKYARKLFNMSSTIPEKYLQRVSESGQDGYKIKPGAKLLFPSEAIEIASHIFAPPNCSNCP